MTQEVFEIHNAPHVVNDGVEAIQFLLREGEFATAPRPGLILLDLDMPRMDGREVLAEVKSDENLRSIPIVVLTTSEAEEDIPRSYSLHANAYVTKPVDFDRFIDVVLTHRSEPCGRLLAPHRTKTFTGPRLCAAIVDRLTFSGILNEYHHTARPERMQFPAKHKVQAELP